MVCLREREGQFHKNEREEKFRLSDIFGIRNKIILIRIFLFSQQSAKKDHQLLVCGGEQKLKCWKENKKVSSSPLGE